MNVLLVIYVVTTLLLSWFFTADLLPPVLTFMLGMFSPAFVALALALTEKEKLRSFFPLGVRAWKENLLGCGVPVIAALGVLAVDCSLGFASYRGPFEKQILSNLVFQIVFAAGEELGWRGYLHKKLPLNRWLPLVVGIIWTLWHARAMIRTPGPFYATAISFALLVVLMSYFLAYLREVSGSILPSTLFHGTWNFLALSLVFSKESDISLMVLRNPLAGMEGPVGLLVCAPLMLPFVLLWWRRFEVSRHNS